jgi:periplasmic protein TonB
VRTGYRPGRGGRAVGLVLASAALALLGWWLGRSRFPLPVHAPQPRLFVFSLPAERPPPLLPPVALPKPAASGGNPAARLPGPPRPAVAALPVVQAIMPDPAPALVMAPPAMATSPTPGDGMAPLAGSGSGTGEGVRDDAGDSAATQFYPADWVTVPGDRELGPYDPPEARRRRIRGDVLLACRVRANRHVHHCRTVQEQPKSWGFGAAALDAAWQFRIYPPRRDGQVIDDAWVLIPIHFLRPPAR